jgi:hypothetical protein
MSYEGLLAGVAAFAMIGLFHPIVIKCEYHFTGKVWPLFLITGLAGILASVLTVGFLSVFLAIFGCTCLWSVHELKEQTERVRKGWFPENPARLMKRKAVQEVGIQLNKE